MIVRAALVLLGCFVAGVANAAPVPYMRGEQFADSPRNWKPTYSTQFYGWEPTRVTGGTGAAGGILRPVRYFNRYADVFLGGALDRNMPFSASGRVALLRASGRPPFVTTAYVGHFSQRFNRYVQCVGIAFNGAGEGAVECQAVLEFSDGTAYVGAPFVLPVSRAGNPLKWSYEWNPTGGKRGNGRLVAKVNGIASILDVPEGETGTFSLDAFGLFQPYFGEPNSNSFLQMYIGGLAYTAFIGDAPVVKIRGPRTIRTTESTIDLRGGASVSMGNRIVKVRYRIHRGGKPTRYRNAEGDRKWSASVRVPKGSSRIEVLARSDSGLAGTSEVTVRRAP